jgi:hypothetical protein
MKIIDLPEIQYGNDYFNFSILGLSLAGMQHSIFASKLPKYIGKIDTEQEIAHTDILRALRLGQAPAGSGYDCWLKGPTIHCYITAAQSWIQQLLRYHHIEVVSSQSTMALVQETPEDELSDQLKNWCLGASTQELTRAYKAIKHYRDHLEDEFAFQRAISALPECTLTLAVKINYMTLKTIYHQRKNHKRLEWKLLCEWVLRLPYFSELVLKGE